MRDPPPQFLEALDKASTKRARTVIDHILKHGYVSTEELKKLYGYYHTAGAAHEIRKLGIPLDTFVMKDTNGRSIGAYKFGEFLEK